MSRLTRIARTVTSSVARSSIRSSRYSLVPSITCTSSLHPSSTSSTPSHSRIQPCRTMATAGAPSSPGPGLINFNLADIGEGIAEVEILKWYVKEGDVIAQFDNVCEVSSDKATVPITSRYDGKVREIRYKIGEFAKVGQPLLVLEVATDPAAMTTSSSSSSSPTPSSTKSTIATTPSTSTSNPTGQVLTSPAVRRIAKEENIDLTTVTPTGPGGRILKEDVLNHISRASSPSTPTTPQQPSRPTPVTPTPKPTPIQAPAPLANDIVIQLTGIQRTMVNTMNAANAVPTFGYSDEIIMDRLAALRDSAKKLAEKQGIKLSYMPFLFKAASMALIEYPQLNCHVNADCTSIIQKASHNIGFAMDTPRGLLVPNIKNVQNLSVLEIARELNRLQELGAAGKLGKDDLTGGTFTLSNIGSIGGTYTSPILVIPEVCIGALGSISTLPRYDHAMNLKPTKIMQISWSADHRILDGATVARFSNVWKSYIEHPERMILAMK